MPRFSGKRAKKIVIILGIILVALLILLFLVDAVYEPPKEILVYPEGNLSDDIFTEQNNNYTPNDGLPQEHSFSNVPYLIDVPQASAASVGSGTVYRISETMYVYLSEYSDPNSVQEVVTSQFPSAILTDFIPEYTNVVTHVDKQGYINGFSSEYIAEEISVSNGAAKSDAVLLGYLLNLPDNDIFAGNHLWVSVGVTDITNENLERCSIFLDAVMNTVRLDGERSKKMHDEAERMAEAAESEAREQTLPPVEIAEPQVEPPQSEQTADPGASYDADIYKIDIPLDDVYEMVKIDVNWSESNTSAILELFNPEKTLYFDPVEQAENSASFVIEGNDIGSYELRIKGAGACGDIETPSVTAVTQNTDLLTEEPPVSEDMVNEELGSEDISND